jgi:hypothetical protein
VRPQRGARGPHRAQQGSFGETLGVKPSPATGNCVPLASGGQLRNLLIVENLKAASRQNAFSAHLQIDMA